MNIHLIWIGAQAPDHAIMDKMAENVRYLHAMFGGASDTTFSIWTTAEQVSTIRTSLHEHDLPGITWRVSDVANEFSNPVDRYTALPPVERDRLYERFLDRLQGTPFERTEAADIAKSFVLANHGGLAIEAGLDTAPYFSGFSKTPAELKAHGEQLLQRLSQYDYAFTKRKNQPEDGMLHSEILWSKSDYDGQRYWENALRQMLRPPEVNPDAGPLALYFASPQTEQGADATSTQRQVPSFETHSHSRSAFFRANEALNISAGKPYTFWVRPQWGSTGAQAGATSRHPLAFDDFPEVSLVHHGIQTYEQPNVITTPSPAITFQSRTHIAQDAELDLEFHSLRRILPVRLFDTPVAKDMLDAERPFSEKFLKVLLDETPSANEMKLLFITKAAEFRRADGTENATKSYSAAQVQELIYYHDAAYILEEVERMTVWDSDANSSYRQNIQTVLAREQARRCAQEKYFLDRELFMTLRRGKLKGVKVEDLSKQPSPAKLSDEISQLAQRYQLLKDPIFGGTVTVPKLLEYGQKLQADDLFAQTPSQGDRARYHQPSKQIVQEFNQWYSQSAGKLPSIVSAPKTMQNDGGHCYGFAWLVAAAFEQSGREGLNHFTRNWDRMLKNASPEASLLQESLMDLHRLANDAYPLDTRQPLYGIDAIAALLSSEKQSRVYKLGTPDHAMGIGVRISENGSREYLFTGAQQEGGFIYVFPDLPAFKQSIESYFSPERMALHKVMQSNGQPRFELMRIPLNVMKNVPLQVGKDAFIGITDLWKSPIEDMPALLADARQRAPENREIVKTLRRDGILRQDYALGAAFEHLDLQRLNAYQQDYQEAMYRLAKQYPDLDATWIPMTEQTKINADGYTLRLVDPNNVENIRVLHSNDPAWKRLHQYQKAKSTRWEPGTGLSFLYLTRMLMHQSTVQDPQDLTNVYTQQLAPKDLSFARWLYAQDMIDRTDLGLAVTQDSLSTLRYLYTKTAHPYHTGALASLKNSVHQHLGSAWTRTPRSLQNTLQIAKGPANMTYKLLGPVGLGISLVSTGMDVHNLISAENHYQRWQHGTNLLFSATGTALAAAATVGGFLGASWATPVGIFTIPFSAVGFGISNLIQFNHSLEAMVNAYVLKPLEGIREAYRSGYTYEALTNRLYFKPGVVISRIDLDKGEVVYGTQYLYGRNPEAKRSVSSNKQNVIALRQAWHGNNYQGALLHTEAQQAAVLHLPGADNIPVYLSYATINYEDMFWRINFKSSAVETLKLKKLFNFEQRYGFFFENAPYRLYYQYLPQARMQVYLGTKDRIVITPALPALTAQNSGEKVPFGYVAPSIGGKDIQNWDQKYNNHFHMTLERAITYELIGKGGQYTVALNEGADYQLSTEGVKPSIWIFQTPPLYASKVKSTESDPFLHDGYLDNDRIEILPTGIHIGGQININISSATQLQDQLLIQCNDEELWRVDWPQQKIQLLQTSFARWSQLLGTDDPFKNLNIGPYLIIKNYTIDKQNLGNAYYEASSKKLLFNRLSAGEPTEPFKQTLQGAQLGMMLEKWVYWYNTAEKRIWKTDLESGQILSEYLLKESPADWKRIRFGQAENQSYINIYTGPEGTHESIYQLDEDNLRCLLKPAEWATSNQKISAPRFDRAKTIREADSELVYYFNNLQPAASYWLKSARTIYANLPSNISDDARKRLLYVGSLSGDKGDFFYFHDTLNRQLYVQKGSALLSQADAKPAELFSKLPIDSVTLADGRLIAQSDKMLFVQGDTVPEGLQGFDCLFLSSGPHQSETTGWTLSESLRTRFKSIVVQVPANQSRPLILNSSPSAIVDRWEGHMTIRDGSHIVVLAEVFSSEEATSRQMSIEIEWEGKKKHSTLAQLREVWSRASERLGQRESFFLDDFLKRNLFSYTSEKGKKGLIATKGNDVILADLAVNQIDGWLGDDTLYGAAENNTYFFRNGDGKDVVIDRGGLDTIEFGQKLAGNKYQIARDRQDLIIHYNDQFQDRMRIKDHFQAGYAMEQIRFSDQLTPISIASWIDQNVAPNSGETWIREFSLK